MSNASPSLIGSFLADVKVLDLSRYLPGSLATLFMVDLGAKVIKIEPPGGDEIRHFGPKNSSGTPAYFAAMHAGKSVTSLNLATDEDRDLFLKLASEADVLVESYRPGVMKRLGLDYETLAKANPRLIYCALSGYGSGGPLEQCAGHDANYLALAGVLDRNGIHGPVNYDPPLADTSASMSALIAIMGALINRERSGRGCHVDAALSDGVMPLQTLELAEFGATGRSPTPDQGLFTGNTACYSAYPTADGRYFMLGAAEPKFWRVFCQVAGRLDWVDRQAEPRPQNKLKEEVAAFFLELTFQECLARFKGVDCCLTPVLNLAEALETEHVRARQLVRRDEEGGIEALFPVHVNGQAPKLRSRTKYLDKALLSTVGSAISPWDH